MGLFHVKGKAATLYGCLFAGVLALSGCGGSSTSNTPTPTPEVVNPKTTNEQGKYSWIRDNVLNVRCMDCHSANQGDGDGLDDADFDTYQDTIKVVKPGDPEHSKLYIMVKTKKMPKGMDPMPGMPSPTPPVPLTDAQVQAIAAWISSGAPNN